MPVGASVTGIEDKAFVSGEVSWGTIGFSTSGVYRLKFYASGTLAAYAFNLSSDTAILEVLPSGRPATMHILQEPGNAAPVSPPLWIFCAMQRSHMHEMLWLISFSNFDIWFSAILEPKHDGP